MSQPTAGISIIVSDPNPHELRAIWTQLQGSPFQVATAQSLHDTHRLIHTIYPYILVLELTQPDGDGIDYIRALRSEVGHGRLAIACLTLRAGRQDKSDAFLAGTDTYWVKPIRLEWMTAQLTVLYHLMQHYDMWHHPEILRPIQPQHGNAHDAVDAS